MGRLRRLVSVVPLSLVVATSAVGSGAVVAQDASPAAVGECVVSNLAPGTPTPEELLATPVVVDEDAFPPLDEGRAADEATEAEAIAAMENVAACVGVGNVGALAGLLTENFARNFVEVPTVYDVPATMEGAGPFEIHLLDDVRVHGDGRVSVRFVYSGFFNGPDAYTAERWVFADENGTWKVDQIDATTFPDDLFPDAQIVEVTMVDYAYLVEPKVLPSGTMIILRATAAEGTTEAGHEAILTRFPEDVTAQQLIQGEMTIEEIEAEAEFFVYAYAQPGQTSDAAVASLEPGTYFLFCYVSEPDGTPHLHLGMATEITVE